MMRIAEYDEVDPLQVLHLNLLCLDFALTPQLAALIRRMDPRAFPCFAIYAVEGDQVLGQVGIFRLPTISGTGATEVGGVWAVCTHPAYRRRGVASLLLNEAHARMAEAELRYSTLGTDGFRVAYQLYRRHGYIDLFSPASALARTDALPCQRGLSVKPAGIERLDQADYLFEQLAQSYRGFARRHTPFFPLLHMRYYLDAEALWLVLQGHDAVGYAVISRNHHMLGVNNLLLAETVDPVKAVAAIARSTQASYVQTRLDRPDYAPLFSQAGFMVSQQSWATFMVKPLVSGVTLEQIRQSFGLNYGRFLVSYMDVT